MKTILFLLALALPAVVGAADTTYDRLSDAAKAQYDASASASDKALALTLDERDAAKQLAGEATALKAQVAQLQAQLATAQAQATAALAAQKKAEDAKAVADKALADLKAQLARLSQ